MRLDATGLTHIGTARKSNQDTIAWHITEDGTNALLLVADGMGGQAGGEIASRLTVETLEDVLIPCLDNPNLDDHDMDDAIQAAITLASERIQQKRADKPEFNKMGTTLVLAWVRDDEAHIAHMGDSRCYLIAGDTITQLTRDDTVVQNMLEDGTITPEDAPNVPFRNILTRALGSPSSVIASLNHVTLAPGDRLLLCSDGLTNALAETQWPAIMNAEESLARQAQGLLNASLQNGASDNISVVLTQLTQGVV